jgi:hypothetical protein
MAKSKAPVYYCKFCEEVLKTDCEFCSASCRHVWMKTRNTSVEQIISYYQESVDDLKKNIIDIPVTCKKRYKKNKNDIATLVGVDLQKQKLEATLCCYIYNKNRDKAMKTFEKLKRYLQESLDETLFDGRKCETGIRNEDKKTITYLYGDEGIRVNAILMKLTIQEYELMLQQVFP